VAGSTPPVNLIREALAEGNHFYLKEEAGGKVRLVPGKKGSSGEGFKEDVAAAALMGRYLEQHHGELLGLSNEELSNLKDRFSESEDSEGVDGQIGVIRHNILFLRADTELLERAKRGGLEALRWFCDGALSGEIPVQAIRTVCTEAGIEVHRTLGRILGQKMEAKECKLSEVENHFFGELRCLTFRAENDREIIDHKLFLSGLEELDLSGSVTITCESLRALQPELITPSRLRALELTNCPFLWEEEAVDLLNALPDLKSVGVGGIIPYLTTGFLDLLEGVSAKVLAEPFQSLDEWVDGSVSDMQPLVAFSCGPHLPIPESFFEGLFHPKKRQLWGPLLEGIEDKLDRGLSVRELHPGLLKFLPELASNSLRDDDLLFLAEHCPNLTHLNLRQSAHLSDEGMKHLSGFTALEALSFTWTPQISAKAIIEAGNSTLRVLDLSGTELTDSDLRALYRADTLPALKKIVAKVNPGVTQEEARYLQEKHPEKELVASPSDLLDFKSAELSDAHRLFLEKGMYEEDVVIEGHIVGRTVRHPEVLDKILEICQKAPDAIPLDAMVLFLSKAQDQVHEYMVKGVMESDKPFLAGMMTSLRAAIVTSVDQVRKGKLRGLSGLRKVTLQDPKMTGEDLKELLRHFPLLETVDMTECTALDHEEWEAAQEARKQEGWPPVKNVIGLTEPEDD